MVRAEPRFWQPTGFDAIPSVLCTKPTAELRTRRTCTALPFYTALPVSAASKNEHLSVVSSALRGAASRSDRTYADLRVISAALVL